MATTIQDIARVAKVSRSAVSVSLGSHNGRSGTRVSESTRLRIKEIAQNLGYQPNVMAKGLAGGRTSTIGILWSLSGPHPSVEMAHNISLKSHRHGYVTQLVNHMSDQAVTIKSLREFKRRGVDGVVIQDINCVLEKPEIVDLLNEFPAALVVGSSVWKAPVDLIHHDRLAACKEVADHFAAAGRRRPVIMGSSMANNEKVRAFMERASMNSMSVGPDSLIEVQYLSHNQTVKACQWTLKERYGKDKAIDFDALFCMSDEGAMASIDWLRKRGVRVPQDVAVIGFNDNEIDDCMDPPLASVERNDDQVADVIDEILFTRLIHPELPPQRRYVSMRFVWRESAGRRRDTG